MESLKARLSIFDGEAMERMTHTAVTGELRIPSLGEMSQERISGLIAENPALESMRALALDKPWVDTLDFVGHRERFGWSFLTSEAIEAVMRATEGIGNRIVSVFSGKGYSEAQLVAQGADVVGFEPMVLTDRWLKDVREGSTWVDYTQFSDRALFMSFPGRPGRNPALPAEVIERFLAAGGELVITIGDRRDSRHVFGSHQSLYDKLADARCIEEVDLPKWPPLVLLTQMRISEKDATLEPVLRVHQFRQRYKPAWP